jgi:hypothetical protein
MSLSRERGERKRPENQKPARPMQAIYREYPLPLFLFRISQPPAYFARRLTA